MGFYGRDLGLRSVFASAQAGTSRAFSPTERRSSFDGRVFLPNSQKTRVNTLKYAYARLNTVRAGKKFCGIEANEAKRSAEHRSA
jgi:hypothetical protein